MMLVYGRLRGELARGALCLKADDWTRCRFAFELEGELIGCFAIRSIGANALRLERAWDARASSWDPGKGLYVPHVVSRKFIKIHSGMKMRITELAPDSDDVRDTVTVKAGRIELFDGAPVQDAITKNTLHFECADLLEVTLD